MFDIICIDSFSVSVGNTVLVHINVLQTSNWILSPALHRAVCPQPETGIWFLSLKCLYMSYINLIYLICLMQNELLSYYWQHFFQKFYLYFFIYANSKNLKLCLGTGGTKTEKWVLYVARSSLPFRWSIALTVVKYNPSERTIQIWDGSWPSDILNISFPLNTHLSPLGCDCKRIGLVQRIK